ncbi:MAG: DUF1223 domain-containing protein [Proteobacteria bacterium]|nr:DUF1223 domain-containing protein [Pseudomonadota bacterium]
MLMKFAFLMLLAVMVFTLPGPFIKPSHAEIEAIHAPVVVELFTSQSCSSCPAADSLLQQLAENPNVIALSCHVTYWNHLSWQDTFSQEWCTRRQQEYASSGGRRGVFTPEIIINGASSMVGSNWQAVSAGLGAAAPIGIIGLQSHGDQLHISLPELTTTMPLSVLLVTYGAPATQHIQSGENGGRTLSTHNPALAIRELVSSWNGERRNITLPREPGMGYAVLAQLPAGPVAAAGKLEPQ